jgi:hypothetical protein
MLVTYHVSNFSIFRLFQSILTRPSWTFQVMIILQDFGSIYDNLQTCSTIFIFFNINFVFDESWNCNAIPSMLSSTQMECNLCWGKHWRPRIALLSTFSWYLWLWYLKKWQGGKNYYSYLLTLSNLNVEQLFRLVQ